MIRKKMGWAPWDENWLLLPKSGWLKLVVKKGGKEGSLCYLLYHLSLLV